MAVYIRKSMRWHFRQSLTVVVAMALIALLFFGFFTLPRVSAELVPDVIPPSVPTNGQPRDTFIKTHDFDFTWGASTDNSEGQISYQFRSSQDSTKIGEDVSDESGAPISDAALDTKIHSSTDSDGTWYWQVRAIDAAGNKGAWSEVWNMTIDTTLPELEVLGPADGEIFGDNQKIIVRSRVADTNLSGGRYTVTIKDTTQDKDADQPSLMDASEKKSVELYLEFNSQDFDEGEYTIKISITDKAGNSRGAERKIIIDKTAPTVSLTPIGVVGGSSVAIYGTARDETALKEYHYQVLDSSRNPMANEVGILSGSIQDAQLGSPWDISSYSSGLYYVTLWAMDQAGNVSERQEISFMIDHTEPIVSIGLVSSPTPTASTPIILQGNVQGSDIASLMLLLNDEELVDLTERVDAEGNWRYELPDGLAQAKYTFSVVATDHYGNVSNSSSSPMSVVGLDVGPYAPPGDSTIAPDLTDGLEQPFVVPATFGAVPSTFDDPDQRHEGDILGATDKDGAAIDENIRDAAISATESGWKLFGVLWYWWLLVVTLIIGISSWVLKVVQRHGVQDSL